MKRQHILSAAVMFFVCFSIHGVSFAQEAAISGRITDSTGAVVVGANITVHNEETGIKRMAASNDVGYYTVGLLQQGNYRILVEMQGFKPIERSGIKLDIHQIARMDFVLEVGEVTQKINVDANASPLNFENAELKQAITPETLRELPLIVGGAVRSAAAFTILMPGVTTGAGANPFDARVNGGLQLGDEAVIDGVTLQQGMKTVSGMVAGYADYPWSPEAISEVSLLTSNYEPQYGSTTSSVMTANTKSGTNEWHGTLYEFLPTRFPGSTPSSLSVLFLALGPVEPESCSGHVHGLSRAAAVNWPSA